MSELQNIGSVDGSQISCSLGQERNNNLTKNNDDLLDDHIVTTVRTRSIDEALNSLTHYAKRIKDFIEQDYENPEELSVPAIGLLGENSHMSGNSIQTNGDTDNVRITDILQAQDRRNTSEESSVENHTVLPVLAMDNEDSNLDVGDDSLNLTENNEKVTSQCSELPDNIEVPSLNSSKNCNLPTLDSCVNDDNLQQGQVLEGIESISTKDKEKSSDNHENALIPPSNDNEQFKSPESTESTNNISKLSNIEESGINTEHTAQDNSISYSLEHSTLTENARPAHADTDISLSPSAPEIPLNDNIKVYVTPSFIEYSGTGKKIPFTSDEFYVLDSNIENTEHHIQIKNKRRKGAAVQEMDPDTVCGIGCFKPQCLQPWATSRAYLFLYSVLGILQGSYYSYLMTILSTIEKRYAFDSKVSGIVMMIDELTPLFLGVFVGYFGGKTHRPRMVGVGMLFSSLACFVSALPYFIYGEAQHLMSINVRNATETTFCDVQRQENTCDEDDRVSTVSAVSFFIIGSFFKGFGNLAYYAIGITYMDDTTKKKNAPIYFAISSSLRLLGPTLGFFMSSVFLKYYEDPAVDPGYGARDPRWIGAWWIGFVLQGTLLLFFSLPIWLFPRRLPRQKTRAFSNTANFAKETLKETLRGLVKAVKRLARNMVFVLFCLGTILSILASYGYFVMMSRYMEYQFRLSASQASLLSGPPSIVTLMIGCIIGGLGIWKWKPNARKLVGGILITEIISGLGFLVQMIPSCGNYDMAGTTYVEGRIELFNECNAGCECSTSSIAPICSLDGLSTYFSPCHAGCSAPVETSVNSSKIFYNCSCIHNHDDNSTTTGSVTKGFCSDTSCWQQALAFVITSAVISGISGLFRVAEPILLLRCVKAEDKSVALGLFETIICGLGFIPYPIMFGALVDSTCLVWETTCENTGNCWLYDVDLLRLRLHGFSALVTIAAVGCFAGVYFLADRITNIYTDEPEAQEPEKAAE